MESAKYLGSSGIKMQGLHGFPSKGRHGLISLSLSCHQATEYDLADRIYGNPSQYKVPNVLDNTHAHMQDNYVGGATYTNSVSKCVPLAVTQRRLAQSIYHSKLPQSSQ